MKNRWIPLFHPTAIFLCLTAFSGTSFAADCVILLHGLARTSSSMEYLEESLTKANYHVVNVDYLSRSFSIETLAESVIPQGIELCQIENPEHEAIHFVTHSLGGILLRQYTATHSIPKLKRVVMLGPPNKGSQVVDNLRNVPGFKAFNGPAGMQLGTDEDSIPSLLGPVRFELGVIAGTRSINLLLSNYLPNPDDGKVSVENTKVEGMCSFLMLPVSHPFLMKNKDVIEQVVSYLNGGVFKAHDAINSCTHSAQKEPIVGGVL